MQGWCGSTRGRLHIAAVAVFIAATLVTVVFVAPAVAAAVAAAAAIVIVVIRIFASRLRRVIEDLDLVHLLARSEGSEFTRGNRGRGEAVRRRNV
jgi:hypothetical protein